MVKMGFQNWIFLQLAGNDNHSTVHKKKKNNSAIIKISISHELGCYIGERNCISK